MGVWRGDRLRLWVLAFRLALHSRGRRGESEGFEIVDFGTRICRIVVSLDAVLGTRTKDCIAGWQLVRRLQIPSGR